MFLTAALLTSLSLVQHFTCFPEDPRSTERAVISLNFEKDDKLPKTGTLFLSSGLDADGEQKSTGVLKMKLVIPADHKLRSNVAFRGTDKNLRYGVVLPTASLARATGSIEIPVRIDMERANGSGRVSSEMSCYSSVHDGDIKKGGGSGAPRRN